MTQRINFSKVPPAVMKAMFGLQAAVEQSGLEHSLLHLVEVRASQINRCGYCLDMHTKEALALGESEQRLFLLDAWRETPLYSERERAALLWCEALTLIADRGAPDEVYEAVRNEFSEEDLIALSLAIVTINSWNRLMIGFQADVGRYRAGDALKMRQAMGDRTTAAAG